MKISIIGAGKVGSSIAIVSLSRLKLNELVLIDLNQDVVEGEALDLGHAAVILSPGTEVVGSADMSKIKRSDFVVITAGKARSPGQTREELLKINSSIIKSITTNIEKHAPKATILVVTNPSTQMAEVARQNCKNKIVAMDTQLDTARLHYYISKELNMPVDKIKSKTFGEHGENMQFDIKEKLTEKQIAKVEELTKKAGITIINKKNHTCWGIAAAVVQEIQRQK